MGGKGDGKEGGEEEGLLHWIWGMDDHSWRVSVRLSVCRLDGVRH